MARLAYNGVATTLGASLSASGTSITFAGPLTHNGGVNVPTISGGNYIPLSITSPTGELLEIVHLTAYTAGTSTGTVLRGREGTTAAVRPAGSLVVNAPTVDDFAGNPVQVPTNYPDILSADLTVARVGPGIAVIAGYIDIDVVPPNSPAGWMDTGARLPAALRPVAQTILGPWSYYNSTVSYRYRLDPTGEVMFQATGANGTFATLSSIYFIPS